MKRQKKNSGNGGTASHFYTVDSCHLSDYTINQSPSFIIFPLIRNEDQILTLPKSYWCSTISQLTSVTRGFLSLPRNRKVNLWNPGYAFHL